MDFDYVVAPSLILLVVVLVSGFCLYRARMLHIKRYGKWRRNTERIVLSLVILVAVAVGGSSIFNALAVHHYRAMNPGHLAGNATIRPSDEKPVLTKPPPPAVAVSRAGRSSKLQLLISPSLAPQ